MAAPSALVFKVPELAQMGYALDQQAEKKRKAEEKEREQYAKSLGVETKMLEGGFKLVGTWKEGSQLAFNQWKEANIEYLRTGSDEAKSNLEARTQQFNQIFGTGLGASTSAASQLNDYRSVGGKGYIAGPEEVDGVYKQFTSPAEFKVENGMIMVSDGDRGFVPATQSSYFATETNPSNTFMLEKRNPDIVAFNPDSYAETLAKNVYNLRGVRVDTGRGVTFNIAEAKNRAVSEASGRLDRDNQYLEGAVTWYYAQQNGLNQGKLTNSDYAQIQSLMQSETFMESAREAYLGAVGSAVERYAPANQVGAAPAPTSKDLEASAFLQTAAPVKATHKTQKSDVYGISFSFSNAPVKLTGENNLYVTNVVVNDQGNIVDYDVFSGGEDLGSMTYGQRSTYATPLTKAEMASLKSELRNRGVYDGMISISKSENAISATNQLRGSSRTPGSGNNVGTSGAGGRRADTPSTVQTSALSRPKKIGG